MNWIPFAFLTAFSLATMDALSKRALRDTDEFVIMWVRRGYALPFVAVPLFFVPIPSLDLWFWVVVAALVPLELLALVLYVKAIKTSPLSLTIPFMALSPVFIVFIAFILLGEWPDRSGMLGIVLIAAGAYILNANASRNGILAPIRAVWEEKGSLLMIAVALIFSVTSTLGKIAVQRSGPVFFGCFYSIIFVAVLTAVVAAKGRLRGVLSRPASFLLIGAFTAAMIISHFIAISLTDVAYMISVKRTNLLFSVLYGRLLFHEERIKERLLGSAVMLAGVVLITVF